jgi:hypothetical protein
MAVFYSVPACPGASTNERTWRVMTGKRIRGKGLNPNHHLWNNNGTWFVHFVTHPSPITKERVRRSLNTKNVVEARKRRDELFRRLVSARQPACPTVMLLAA